MYTLQTPECLLSASVRLPLLLLICLCFGFLFWNLDFTGRLKNKHNNRVWNINGRSPLNLFFITFFCLFTYRNSFFYCIIYTVSSTDETHIWTKCFFSPADMNRVTYSRYVILRLIYWPLLVLNEMFCGGHWNKFVFSLNKLLVTLGKGSVKSEWLLYKVNRVWIEFRMYMLD